MRASDLNQMDFFELGDKTSLICADPNMAEIVRFTLKELGYKSHSANTADPAIERMRYTQYDCIVVQENLAGFTLQTNTVLHFLSNQPMAQRRNSFVCLIGDSFKTLDAMQAFAESVHLVINPLDLPNMAAILKKGLAEFEVMYRVFRIAVEAQGDKRRR